jgi:hypothetical protein
MQQYVPGPHGPLGVVGLGCDCVTDGEEKLGTSPPPFPHEAHPPGVYPWIPRPEGSTNAIGDALTYSYRFAES